MVPMLRQREADREGIPGTRVSGVPPRLPGTEQHHHESPQGVAPERSPSTNRSPGQQHQPPGTPPRSTTLPATATPPMPAYTHLSWSQHDLSTRPQAGAAKEQGSPETPGTQRPQPEGRHPPRGHSHTQSSYAVEGAQTRDQPPKNPQTGMGTHHTPHLPSLTCTRDAAITSTVPPHSTKPSDQHPAPGTNRHHGRTPPPHPERTPSDAPHRGRNPPGTPAVPLPHHTTTLPHSPNIHQQVQASPDTLVHAAPPPREGQHPDPRAQEPHPAHPRLAQPPNPGDADLRPRPNPEPPAPPPQGNPGIGSTPAPTRTKTKPITS
ncbi:vegetative cell wall protein gp1-like [Sphaeramia orbicularis]|uniref:vegetative cell wall protein gp1-like n=1 Tax=Sphaeramia orbicularis TaxID=375764 RepID=UPI0011806C77|nr:vegetative cell wall protein gp1-like [Sphaeramia orbicularis]